MMKSITRRDFMKGMLAGGVALGSAGLLAACGSSSSETSSESSSSASSSSDTGSSSEASTAASSDDVTTLYFGCKSDPKTFGPWDGGGGGRNMTNMAVYETMAYMLEGGSFSYCIMKDYTNPSDGVYDITIYDYVSDSDGNPITADDVVFSFEKCAEEGNWATYTAAMASITKIGDYEVEIVMSNERPDSFSGLLENVMIVSQAAYEGSADNMSSWPIGTGSYVLEEYVGGAYMTYTVNDNYWQTDESLVAYQSRHNVPRYTVEFISETAQHSISLETGELDCTNGCDAADYVNFINDDGTPKDGYDYIESEKAGFTALAFNCGEGNVCSDVNLRKAIAYAIDTEAMTYAAYGSAGVAQTSFSQTQHFDYTEEFTPEDGYFEYSEETAKSYLDQSGYNGEEIVLYAQNDTEVTTMCELIRVYCEAVGINVKVETFDTTLYNSYLYAEDPEWDMTFCFCEGGDYTYTALAWALDMGYFTGDVNICQIYDETLQELFDIATTVSTFSVENTKAFLDYVNEECYMVAMAGHTQDIIWNTNTIGTMGTTKTQFDPVPGACTLA
ncbi:MAG: ABC transporter substrate-binding protein [Lachnospiraceae bacterium]|nr:ABC transporter substrate-binding protein [Lachnospiraceae bacterium]